MSLKIKATPIGATRRFPVKYKVLFTGTPKPREVAQSRKKVEGSLKAHLAAQERDGASPRFKLTFKWKEILSYELLVNVKRISSAAGGGTDAPPKPKSSIPPM